MKRRSRFSLIALIVLAVSGQTFSQQKSKEYNDSWSGVEKLTVSHRYGTLNVYASDNSDVRLEAVIFVKANKPEDAQVVADNFTVEARPFGTTLELQTAFNSKNWVTNNGVSTIKFENGQRAKGVRNIDIRYNLYIPELTETRLANKYNDIIVNTDISGDLHIKQYDADVAIPEVSGKLTLELKYGKAVVASAGESIIQLYDAELELEESSDIELTSKYSDFTIKNCNIIEIDSYDDNGFIEAASESLRIDDKYSDYAIGTTGSAYIAIYDGEVRLDKADEVSGKSKYSKFKYREVGSLDLQSSYDDSYEIRNLGSLDCNDSKYTNFEIEDLNRSFQIISYDDNIYVTNVNSSFELLDLDCKYTDVRVPLDRIAGYDLRANTKQGSLKHGELTSTTLDKESDGNIELRARVGSSSANAEVIVKAYDSDINLR